MKIYKKVIIDIKTGKKIFEDSFEYEGKVALCQGSGGHSIDYGATVGKKASGFSDTLEGEIGTTRSTYINQLLEALITGGVGARIPIISQAVEGVRRASSKSLEATEADLARSGLAGTPYGEQIKASTALEGNVAASSKRADMIQALLDQIPGFIQGTQQTQMMGYSPTKDKGGYSMNAGGGVMGGGNSGNTGSTTTAAAGKSKCCFIFIASHGYLHPVVRRYRNNHTTLRNRRGYCWLADRLVPLMKKYKAIKILINFLMIKPMTSYGKYYYGYNKHGWIFAGLTKGWLLTYSILGMRPPYQRKGTKEIV